MYSAKRIVFACTASELKCKCKRGGKPRVYLEQLRGKDEDEGDDRLTLAGRCPPSLFVVCRSSLSRSLSLFSFFVCSWNLLLANEDGGVERLFHQHCFLSSVLAFLVLSSSSFLFIFSVLLTLFTLSSGFRVLAPGFFFCSFPLSVAFSGFYKAREWPLFTCSCLTIVRHERLYFFEKKQGQKICSPLCLFFSYAPPGFSFPFSVALSLCFFLSPSSVSPAFFAFFSSSPGLPPS